jgi:hypothetical protein
VFLPPSAHPHPHPRCGIHLQLRSAPSAPASETQEAPTLPSPLPTLSSFLRRFATRMSPRHRLGLSDATAPAAWGCIDRVEVAVTPDTSAAEWQRFVSAWAQLNQPLEGAGKQQQQQQQQQSGDSSGTRECAIPRLSVVRLGEPTFPTLPWPKGNVPVLPPGWETRRVINFLSVPTGPPATVNARRHWEPLAPTSSSSRATFPALTPSPWAVEVDGTSATRWKPFNHRVAAATTLAAAATVPPALATA